ncbi:hypothetical protein V496_01234 [Pseudogymnoascus sp. VKM F-4515 (FW-2607)]|nr:hypothetical protein V496_01234 [Pseudogymnoascus sp. VKM F-4515 (FW-2607)]
MAISSLFIVLAIVTSAWSLAQTENRGGNSACAQWCAANFAPTPGANCTRLAAHGTGPCYVCGPRSTNPREKLCGDACSDTSSDSINCGTCGNVCISGTTCQSGACAPLPGSCLNYTASCSDVINGILATNSIASPQLVDYRMQTAILGITSPSDFLAALGANPCQIYADPTEHDTCVELLANSEFVSQLTDKPSGC